MDLRFPSVFSEDEMMWTDADVDCRLSSLALQAGRGWAMDLRFPSVFSEDETMWTDADCGLRITIVGPPGWQRMGDGSSLSLCIQ